MGILKYFKDWKELERKIRSSFTKRDKIMQENKVDIAQLREDVKLLHEYKLLHEQLHSVTARTTAPITTRAVLNKTEKRILIRFDSMKLMSAIQSEIKQKHTTNVIRDNILNRFDIGERCFYNYLKKVRELLHEQLHSVTARTTAHKKKTTK